MEFEDATQATTMAIRAIFNRWTALSLTISHQFNGATYLVDDLLQNTVSMATDPSKRYDMDAYVDLFYSTFEKMQTDIEDGSPEQVAQHILKIRDAAAVGNFAPAKEIVQRAGVTMQAITTSIEGMETSDGENDEKDADFADPGVAPRGPRTRSTPLVDEDGFQEVVSRRRRH